MTELIDFLVAIAFILVFILCMPYNTVESSSSGMFIDFINNKKINKDKPCLRGVLHIASSCTLPVVYWFMGSDNFSMEAMILCCTLSGIYHRVAPYIGERYIPTFQLMDYLGSDVTILAYATMLFERYGDKEWIDRMPLVIATLFITEFILFYYHYHVKPLKELNRMITHVLCLGFTLFSVIKYKDYVSPLFLLMCGLYFVAFYIFAVINSEDPEHWVWSQHETFHLILLFAFIVHLYISMK